MALAGAPLIARRALLPTSIAHRQRQAADELSNRERQSAIRPQNTKSFGNRSLHIASTFASFRPRRQGLWKVCFAAAP